jgi:hypothetical protein
MKGRSLPLMLADPDLVRNLNPPFPFQLKNKTKPNQTMQSMNSIRVLAPYKYEGMWVFDDPAVDLVREPFIAGIDQIIDQLVADIPGAEGGFTLLFSTMPFPGHNIRLEWRRAESGGNWYYCQELDKEGWLCPALYKYFEKAPEELYCRTEARP